MSPPPVTMETSGEKRFPYPPPRPLTHSMEGKAGERIPLPPPNPHPTKHCGHFGPLHSGKKSCPGSWEGLFSLSLSAFSSPGGWAPPGVSMRQHHPWSLLMADPRASLTSCSGRVCGDESEAASPATPASSHLWNHQDKGR